MFRTIFEPHSIIKNRINYHNSWNFKILRRGTHGKVENMSKTEEKRFGLGQRRLFVENQTRTGAPSPTCNSKKSWIPMGLLLFFRRENKCWKKNEQT